LKANVYNTNYYKHKIPLNYQNRNIHLYIHIYCYLLIVIIGYYNAKVGRGGSLNNFVDYAKYALSKIGVDKKQVHMLNPISSIVLMYMTEIRF